MKNLFSKKIRGIPIPHNKNTAGYAPETLPVPAEVRLPMRMHSGAPAIPVVSPGDRVKTGRLIGEADGPVSSPVHASVTGTVKSVESYDAVTGEKTAAVTITSDPEGSQAIHEGVVPRDVSDTAQFLMAVRDSGVVGLGGAGYPTAAKLTLRDNVKRDYILVNGAECEPYITSDTRTMIDDAGYVWEGALLLKEYLKPDNVIICIEDNKPAAIQKMSGLCAGIPGVGVHVLPSAYPQGERKVLVYNVTGRIVPEGGRLPDIGCVVINCATVAVIAKFIKTGMPLVSRCVTVDGSAVSHPKNIISPIGTPVRNLLDYCGGLKTGAGKIILGGPIMGTAIPNLDIPTVKTTNALLAFAAGDADPQSETACVNCGRCVLHCPMGLMPSYIENAFELKKLERLRKLKVDMCAECGCCAYVCPAKRPLSQVMALSMHMLRGAR
jgi:electron transport complex protein RnfC